MSKEINNKLEKQAIGIVAQLFDLAEVPVEKRQEINDIAYDYMFEQLRLHSVVAPKDTLCNETESNRQNSSIATYTEGSKPENYA
jgi:hypothetical protein